METPLELESNGVSMKKEQSAIEAIYKILDEIKEIKTKMDVMDNNIKLLNNKVGRLNPNKKSVGPSASAPVAVQQSMAQPVTEPIQTVKVFGRIKNQRKKPLKDVYIKIYSPKGEVIKSRTTDSEGYWEARILPGSYSVEMSASHIIKKARPINKNIVIDKTMNEYEVK